MVLDAGAHRACGHRIGRRGADRATSAPWRATSIRGTLKAALNADMSEFGVPQADVARALGYEEHGKVSKSLTGDRKLQVHEVEGVRAVVQLRRDGASSDTRHGQSPHSQTCHPTNRLGASCWKRLSTTCVYLLVGIVVDQETTRRMWPLPTFLIRDNLLMVVGDSMEATLRAATMVFLTLQTPA